MKYLQLLILLFSIPLFSQQTPGEKQKEAIAIVGATAHLGNGKLIENSTILFENGSLTYVGTSTSEAPKASITISAKGKHVYPGFIATNSTLGLQEIGSVKATRDQREIGAINPEVRAIIAYNSESKIIETIRPNGVLIGQVTPRGGTLSGTSSIVQFDAWNWKDALIKEDDGIHMNWPKTARKQWGSSDVLKESKYKETLSELKSLFRKASVSEDKDDLKSMAIKRIYEGKSTLYIHVNEAEEMKDAILFTKKLGLKTPVIVGANEGYRIIPFLKDHQVSILVQRPHSLPNYTDSPITSPFENAVLLHKAGLLVAIQNAGDMEQMQTRNLPFLAGTVASYGLDKEEALKMICQNPAKILGIDAQMGSLEVGKDATLFISEGDALDMRTNKLSHAFIQGRAVSLDSHQTDLYEKFQKKYERQ